MNRLLIVAFMIFVLWKLTGGTDQVELGPGVKAPAPPSQKALEGREPFTFKGYKIIPLAEFEAMAKILAKEAYYTGEESELSPSDLVLGWQNMSDESVIQAIDIRQSGRWYYWSTEQFPIPRREIETQSANMHMIPSNEFIAVELANAKQGQIVQLKGYLVRVESQQSDWHWQSSLTREDTGDGACELVYLTAFEIVEATRP